MQSILTSAVHIFAPNRPHSSPEVDIFPRKSTTEDLDVSLK